VAIHVAVHVSVETAVQCAVGRSLLGLLRPTVGLGSHVCGAVTAECGPSAAARVCDYLVVTCGYAQYDFFDVSKHGRQSSSIATHNYWQWKKKGVSERWTHWLVKDDDGGEG
jgi:hypothetical protein